MGANLWLHRHHHQPIKVFKNLCFYHLCRCSHVRTPSWISCQSSVPKQISTLSTCYQTLPPSTPGSLPWALHKVGLQKTEYFPSKNLYFWKRSLPWTAIVITRGWAVQIHVPVGGRRLHSEPRLSVCGWDSLSVRQPANLWLYSCLSQREMPGRDD